MLTKAHFLRPLALFGAALACATALAQSAAPLSDGEVRKVDKGSSKITLKHGEIQSLDMPPMTMVFTVKEPRLLDGVQPGDQVKFSVVRENGKLVVTELQRLGVTGMPD